MKSHDFRIGTSPVSDQQNRGSFSNRRAYQQSGVCSDSGRQFLANAVLAHRLVTARRAVVVLESAAPPMFGNLREGCSRGCLSDFKVAPVAVGSRR
jgi:hypothetical protein